MFLSSVSWYFSGHAKTGTLMALCWFIMHKWTWAKYLYLRELSVSSDATLTCHPSRDIWQYLKCCRGQLSTRMPPGVSWQAQRAVHQLRLNRLSPTASYQALIGQIESPTCPHCGSGDETAEHLLLLCPKWAAERQRYFGDSIDITDVFQDYESLVEFLISLGHLSPHIGSTWQARHDNKNNNNIWQFLCLCCWTGERTCFVQSPVNSIVNMNSIVNFTRVSLKIFR